VHSVDAGAFRKISLRFAGLDMTDPDGSEDSSGTYDNREQAPQDDFGRRTELRHYPNFIMPPLMLAFLT
jgi:hypothetical protein